MRKYFLLQKTNIHFYLCIISFKLKTSIFVSSAARFPPLVGLTNKKKTKLSIFSPLVSLGLSLSIIDFFFIFIFKKEKTLFFSLGDWPAILFYIQFLFQKLRFWTLRWPDYSYLDRSLGGQAIHRYLNSLEKVMVIYDFAK